ncbi:MAG TPA: Gfo/Idh/MocA family oxidoreductase [Bryobacteraceae bacterium]|jgi:predicted dehydrogenase|nr:Gfo/Idh/MocA family oxidoreductase [Bryobacteraceae bacterium]
MNELSRRTLFKNLASAAVASAGPAALSALAASDKIQMGWIGSGGRGRYLLDMAYAGSASGINVTDICDTYSGNLAKGKDIISTKGGKTPKTHSDYRQLLADKSIDAVVIATPEHLHHRMLLDAVAAGKNVYVEKPLAHTIEEAQEIRRVTAGKKNVIQVGTQNRSNSLYQMAKTLMSQGLIGDCHYVRAFWYRNALANGAPAWRYDVPSEANEQNADWKRFLGTARSRSWDPQRYFQWRLYWDYSNGIATDLMVHQTDISAFCLGIGISEEVIANGGVYRWTGAKDDREVPDTLSCILDYPTKKMQVNYSCYLGNARQGYGEQFMGNEGTIEVISRQTLSFYPEDYAGVPDAVKARKPLTLTIPGNDNLAVQSHIRNWLNAIRGADKLIAPVQAGYEAAITGLLSTVSLRNGRKVKWDNAADKYTMS